MATSSQNTGTGISISIDTLAQGLHVALGALFVLLPASLCDRQLRVGLYGALAAIVFVAVKEFWFDLHYETPATSGGLDGGIRDAACYGVGTASALALLSVRWLLL